MAYVRSEEEFGRRGGLKGTKIHVDSEGRNIEFDYTKQRSGPPRPILILENGLGSPLESWDWICHFLRPDFDILRYHRRGYGRTKSLMRPADILEELLRELSPTGPIVFISHSVGALVTANAISESRYIQKRTQDIFIVDGTDDQLLTIDRSTKQRSGRFKQTIVQEAIGSVTGLNRWVTSSVERDVEYRPDIQRSFLITASCVRTQVAALREYLSEPVGHQEDLGSMGISQHVLAAADNVEQQTSLATRLGADFTVVPESSHRSIIGKLSCAEVVAENVRKNAHAA